MKLALGLFGISYVENHEHWFKKDNVRIDFELSVENYKKRIINHFKNLGYEIDIYLSTYKSEKTDKLLEIYKPRKKIILDKFINDRFISRNFHFMNCLRMIKNSNVDYKMIIMTRFDLLFNESFDNVDINLDKMNLVSELHHKKKVDDNLYIFSSDKLNSFIKLCGTYKKKTYHEMKLDLNKLFGINYLANEKKPVAKLSFFTIVRNSKFDSNLKIFK